MIRWCVQGEGNVILRRNVYVKMRIILEESVMSSFYQGFIHFVVLGIVGLFVGLTLVWDIWSLFGHYKLLVVRKNERWKAPWYKHKNVERNLSSAEMEMTEKLL